jgi:hypothetical protein
VACQSVWQNACLLAVWALWSPSSYFASKQSKMAANDTCRCQQGAPVSRIYTGPRRRAMMHAWRLSRCDTCHHLQDSQRSAQQLFSFLQRPTNKHTYSGTRSHCYHCLTTMQRNVYLACGFSLLTIMTSTSKTSGMSQTAQCHAPGTAFMQLPGQTTACIQHQGQP